MKLLPPKRLAEIRELHVKQKVYYENNIGPEHLAAFNTTEALLDHITALEGELVAEERANCVSMDTEMKLKDTITALENEKTKLVKKWRDIVKRNEGTRDFSKRRAMNYLAACANELIEQEYK